MFKATSNAVLLDLQKVMNAAAVWSGEGVSTRGSKMVQMTDLKAAPDSVKFTSG